MEATYSRSRKTHRRSPNKFLAAGLIAVIVGLFAHLAGVAASPASAEQQVQTAWRNATLADSFDFATDVAQTTYPAPALTNVGRSSRTESMRIEGKVDRPAESILMNLWSGAGHVLNAGDALELRVVRGAAEGRVSGGDWQTMDNVADAFAPSGDMLGFLAGAKNITRQTVTSSGQLPTVYTFDVDGPALAEHLRVQLEDQLAAKGELPAGVHLDTPGVYYGAVGSGEVWLTADGYPTRMTLSLDLPEQENGERVTVHFTSQLSAFQPNHTVASTSNPLAAGLQSVVATLAATFTPQVNQSLVFSFAFVALCVWLLIRYGRSRRVYAVVAVTMIITLVFSPLWQAGQVYAFARKLNDQAAQQTAASQSQAESDNLLRQIYANTWTPNQDPLGIASQSGQPAATPDLPVASTLPDVMAGVDRALYTTLSPLAAGDTPEPNSDEDQDGLTYNQEVQLGTDPTEADSDGDGLRDDAEVKGFDYKEKTWYSDPNSADTNNDGLTDFEECPQRVDDLRGICQDTNANGVPDMFDNDNDGDGVPDRIDPTPFRVMGTNGLVGTGPVAFTADTPLQFNVSGLANVTDGQSYQTFVDFQLRPTEPKHLWYALNVYDWPNGDEQGQIRRPLTDTNGAINTTFADYAPDGLSNNANGDLRLMPMLEIRLTGGSLPLPFITPHASQLFANQGITGSVALDVAGSGADTQITFAIRDTATYTADLAVGSCASADSLATGSVRNGSTLDVLDQRVTALANGKNFIRLTDALSSTHFTCIQLIDIPNGANTDQMVDTSFFAPYGVSVRDLDDKTVAAYVPLNLIDDPATGDRVAFGARMPYWPSDPTSWGENQQVRMVWLLNLLTPDGFTSVVQTYPDSWTLTSLSAREDRGVNVSVIFEDPATDKDLAGNENLLALMSGLEQSFMAGRSSNQTQRDLTGAHIAPRFDNTQNAGTTDVERWKLPQNAFRVFDFAYSQYDEIAKINMTETVKLLDTYFVDNGQARTTAPLFLYATESRSRRFKMDSRQPTGNTGPLLTLNLDPDVIKPQVTAGLNWVPYHYVPDQSGTKHWQTYPLAEYADYLKVNFQQVFSYKPETERPADVALMQGMYLAAIDGYNQLVEYDGRVLTKDQATSDDDLAAGDDPIGVKIYEKALDKLSNKLADHFIAEDPLAVKKSSQSFSQSVVQFVKSVPDKVRAIPEKITSAIKGKYSDLTKGVADIRKLAKDNKLAASGALVVGATVVTLYLLQTSKDGKGVAGALSGALALKSTVTAVMDVNDGLKALRSFNFVKSIAADPSAFLDIAEAARASAKSAKVGAVVAIVVAWGMAIAQLAMAGGSLTTSMVLDIVATAVAATIVALIMLAIALIPGVGQLIAAIVALIDVTITAVCKALGDDFEKGAVGKRLCKGLSGLVGELIKTFLYSRRTLVGNLKSPKRLAFDDFALTWNRPELGLVKDAAVTLKLGITNTIVLNGFIKSGDELGEAIIPLPFDPLSLPFFWQLNDDNLKSATFKYQLQTGADKTDIHSGLERNTMNSDWQSVPGQDHAFFITRPVTITTDKATGQTGLNQPLDLYLAEGQATPAQQCIGVPVTLWPPVVIPSCWIATDESTNSIPLGESLIYDILPRTLDGFTALTPGGDKGGYSLAWAQTGDLIFGVQKDADGDGLINKQDGGNDPNDSTWDSDNDGLSDGSELRLGTNPGSADTDRDLLNDYDEVVLGTNPLRADTDRDGLTDKEEIDGWRFVYDLTSTGQLASWVTSDPLNPDADIDDLTDVLERTYGFNPRVKSNPHVLTYESQVIEQAAPRLWLRFEHPVNTLAFADSSGYSAPGACVDATTCPTTGVVGKYGNAALFDGVNDRIVVPVALSANSDLTWAGWVYPQSTDGQHHALFALDTSNGEYGVAIWTQDQTKLYGIVQDATFTTNPELTLNAWNHVALVRSEGTYTVYVNGAFAASGLTTSRPALTRLELGGIGTTYYNQGRLDEVAIFDRALSASEVQSVQAGRFNPGDLIVKPGDRLAYTASVKNELLGPFANGLLKTDFPLSVDTSNLPPKTFVLEPQQQTDLAGVVTVSPLAPSGAVTLTQVAEASIQDRSAQSNYAEAWIKFDESSVTSLFADVSGNVPPRSATCSSAAGQCPASGVPGVNGSAARFDGSDDVLELRSLVPISGSFTVAAWVKPGSTGTLAIFGSRAPFEYGFDVKLQNGNQIHSDIGDGTDWLTTQADAPFNYAPGVWVHIAYVVSPNRYTIYANGIQVIAGTFTGVPLLNDANHSLTIGSYGGAAEHWTGDIDDVRVFARALSGTDIAAIANRPVLRLTFDGGTPGAETFADASGRGTAATCAKADSNCPALQGGVLGAAPRFYDSTDAGSANDFYRIASNPALNLNDGNYTLMAWINPANTDDSAYNAYPQGLIGYNSGDANSMPALQRVGLKLRFGFGDALSWRYVQTPNDVLAVNVWQQVAATFDGTTVKFFVNGLEVNNQILRGKPNASDFQLMLGRSDNNWRVRLVNAYIDTEGSDYGPDSELTVRFNKENGAYYSHCFEDNIDSGETENFDCGGNNWADDKWFDFKPGYSIDLWEDDGGSQANNNDSDETVWNYTLWGTDINGRQPEVKRCASSNTCVTARWDVDGLDAVAFAGRMDEVAIYKRPLSAAEVLAVYDTIKGGQLFRLDEPPGSSEFNDETGAIKFTCAAIDPNTPAKCPTAGVAGRFAQGTQFVAGQLLSAPFNGSAEQSAVSLWFKTGPTNDNQGLFSIRDNLFSNGQVWLDSGGNITARWYGAGLRVANLKNASQSSTYQNNPAYAASQAIDGNPATINHTDANPNEWWQADLSAGTQLIQEVRVTNTQDRRFVSRLNDFSVILYNNNTEVWRTEHLPADPNVTIVKVPIIRANRVRIQKNFTSWLNLAEVEVRYRWQYPDPETIATTDANYADNQWHHLVFSQGGQAGAQAIYVDGVLRASGRREQTVGPDNILYLGLAENQGFLNNGFIDQVRLFSRGLAINDVRRLYADVPQAQFKFDETFGAATFVNAANTGNATCAAANCPLSGVLGRVGLAAEFNGMTSTLQAANSQVFNFTGSFAIGVWLNAKDWAGTRAILWKESQYDLWTQSNTLYFRVFGVGVVTMTVPDLNQWQYVVANYAGGSLQLYLNGSLVPGGVAGSGIPRTTANPLFIGARDAAGTLPFSGQLDELSFYNRYLSEPEIRAQYLYQVGLVAERQAYRVTIDNDAPDAVLRSDTPFLPNTDRLMDIHATDPTSSISLVELGSQKYGEDDLLWAGAPLCRDVVDTSEWCITFIPRGEGRYTLRPRATDAVGNTGGVSDTIVYVDGTGPQIELNAQPDLVAPIKQSVGWTVSLSGTVNDPTIPGDFAGSGVMPSSVKLTLLDATGSPAGQGQQRATVDGDNWQVDYAFVEAEPSGKYTLSAEAADEVGNATQVTLGAIQLDAVGPVAELSTNFPVVISSTTQFSGTATEIDMPRDARLFLPFDEPAGATAFLDRYAPRNVTAGQYATQSSGGQADAGLAVDGSTDGNYTNGSVTQTENETQPWWQVDLSVQHSIGRITLWNRTDCCSEQLSDLNVFVSADPFESTDPTVTEGQAGVLTFYAETVGERRDFAIVDDKGRPVQARYVRVQLNGAGSLSLAEVQVFSAQLSPGYCNDQFCPTMGEPGAVGNAALFNGVENQVRVVPPFELARASFSVAFWARREAIMGQNLHPVFTSGTADDNQGVVIGFNEANQFVCGFMGDNLDTGWIYRDPDTEWHHWVCTFAADTRQITIYRDGVKVRYGAIADDYQGTGDWVIGAEAWSDANFQGGLDELAVFDRVLSDAEIRHISQQTVAGVKSVDVAFTSINTGINNEPEPADQLLYLPFEDNVDQAGQLVFKDLVAGAVGTCGAGYCPSTGGVGMRGAAALFNGSDLNYISVNMAEAVNGSFTVAAWVKPEPDDPTFGVGILSARTDFSLRLRLLDGNTLHADIGDGTVWLVQADALLQYTIGRWVHVAVAVTPDGYALYANGVEIDAGNFSGTPVQVNAGDDLLIGNSGEGPLMKGLLDEVRVFGRDLTLEEIRSLYVGSEPVLKLDFENNFDDTSPWSWTQTVDRPTDEQTPRLRIGEGQVGRTSLAFDGVNDQLSIKPAYDLANSSFTIGFWLKRNQIESYQQILSLGSGADGSLTIAAGHGYFYCMIFNGGPTTPNIYPDTDWHHWTCLYNADTQEGIIYRDGVQVARETGLLRYFSTEPWLIGGDSHWHLNGGLDDLRVYPRALSAEEVYAWAHSNFYAANLAASSADVTLSQWTATPPAGLEGVYRFDARGRDLNGLGDLTNGGNEQWLGLVDSLAPRIVASRQYNEADQTHHVFTVQDFDLDVDNGFTMSGVCSETGTTQPQVLRDLVYSNQAWYRLGGGEPRPYEVSVTCSLEGVAQPPLSLTACDLLGNCTGPNLPDNAINVSRH